MTKKFNEKAILTGAGDGLSGVWQIAEGSYHLLDGGCDGWFESVNLSLVRPREAPTRKEINESRVLMVPEEKFPFPRD
jgi:hypothetical protein